MWNIEEIFQSKNSIRKEFFKMFFSFLHYIFATILSKNSQKYNLFNHKLSCKIVL